VLKANIGSPLALAVLVALAGCSKQGAEQSSQPHPVPTMAPTAEVDLAGIAKADGGKTVAEVFAEKDQLGGQTVVVRGKVVKTNANIMGKNWLHVRDGSGAEGANDLTVTTAAELPQVGDTVVVTGPVTLNKDFGMGYAYDVIVEDAEVTIEQPGS